MKKFLAGWIACVAIRSIEQDIIGKDAYIEYLRLMWVSAWYTIPLATLMLFIAGTLYLSKTKFED